MEKRIVTIFGSAGPAPCEREYQSAQELGRAVAGIGWTVCNGGYGGTMEAAARGAREAGGHTIGVTCTRIKRGGPNAYIRQEIPTFDLMQRLNTLIQLGRSYVVLPGGTGTLAELALTLEMLNKRLITGERPIILYGDYWSSAIELAAREQATMGQLRQVEDVESVVNILRELDM